MKTTIDNPKDLIWNEATVSGEVMERFDHAENMSSFFIGQPFLYLNKETGESETRILSHYIEAYTPEAIETVATLKPGDFVEVTGKLTTWQDNWDSHTNVKIILTNEGHTLTPVKELEQQVAQSTVTLVGNVGLEPKIVSKNGIFAAVSLATNDKWIDQRTGEERQKSHWHSLILPGRGAADFALDNLRKGTCIQVTGALSYENWKDKNGVEHTKPRITVTSQSQVKLLEFNKERTPEKKGVER